MTSVLNVDTIADKAATGPVGADEADCGKTQNCLPGESMSQSDNTFNHSFNTIYYRRRHWKTYNYFYKRYE